MVRNKEVAMNRLTKVLILVAMMIYVVSPIDACPGPIDDLIVVLLSMAAQRKMMLPEKT